MMASSSRQHRIFIWPSDDDDTDAPKLPVVSVSSSHDTASSDADGFNQNNTLDAAAVAIIGWLDETLSSSITTVAIGSIPLLPCSVGIAAIATKSNVKDERDEAKKNYSESISRAIDILAKQHPCKYSNGSSDCGNCYECATYLSLRVLNQEISNIATTCNPVDSQKDDGNNDQSHTKTKGEISVENGDCGNSDSRSKRHQIILYNPKEAERWHHEHIINPRSQQDLIKKNEHSQRRKYYPEGTWQRNALRMGEALSVLDDLSLVMKNMQSHLPEEGGAVDASDDDATTSVVEGESEDYAVQSIKRRHRVFDGILSQSLLLLHLKSEKQHHRASNNIFVRIPLLSVVRHFAHDNTASRAIIDACNELPRPRVSRWSKRSMHVSSQFVALILDSFFGLIIGYILLTYPLHMMQHLIRLWNNNFHDRRWNEGLEWLESFPAGFKLNVALTHQMGKEVRLAIVYHQKMVSFLFPPDFCVDTVADAIMGASDAINSTVGTALVRYLGLSSMIFGARFFFALAFDVTRIALLHIHFLSSFFAACQRLEVCLFSSLWLLFRGKKRNILRRRSDHLKYDHMQLLVGIIMFTICLFTFTTILVYHCFFAIVNYVAELCVCGLWWYGFMVIEGVMQYDFIVTENKRQRGDTEKSWIGRDVQFHPVAMEMSDKSYFGGFIGSLKKGSQPCIQRLFSHVSISSKNTSTMKAVFPAKSNSSIIVNAFCAFVVSKTSRLVTFFRKLLFGSSCPVASSFVDISQTTRRSMVKGLH